MRKLVAAVALVTATLGMSACDSGGGYGGGGGWVEATWYDAFGNACGSLRAGCAYVSSIPENGKAHISEDPAYFYNDFITDWHYIYDDYYGYEDWFWCSMSASTGVCYDAVDYDSYGFANDYYGYAINNGKEKEGRDIVSKMGKSRESIIKKAGLNLAQRHGLSAEVGVRIARTLSDYNKLARNRERTQKDLENLTKNVYGVSLNDVVSALTTQNKAKINELVEDAAEHLQTSPENMKEIIKKIYKQEL